METSIIVSAAYAGTLSLGDLLSRASGFPPTARVIEGIVVAVRPSTTSPGESFVDLKDSKVYSWWEWKDKEAANKI